MSITTNATQIPGTAEAMLGYAARGYLVFLCHETADGLCACRKGAACGKNAGKLRAVKPGGGIVADAITEFLAGATTEAKA